MKVTLIQKIVPEYRVKLFQQLHSLLHHKDIGLTVLYGQEQPGATPVSVSMTGEWTRRYKNKYIEIKNTTFVLQSVPLMTTLQSDLIIVEQANALLLNFCLFLLKPIFRYKLAFWGHGYNRQSLHKSGVSERLKSIMVSRVDWWFAYTNGTRDYLVSNGVANGRITTLRNTIDTDAFQSDLDAVDEKTLSQFIHRLSLTPGKTALYCGGFTTQKSIDILLKSSLMARQMQPDFSLMLIGSGPEQSRIDDFVRNHSWAHCLGRLHGIEKAVAFKASSCLLMPGLVGLAAVDSIISELPLIYRKLETHGPEIEYVTELNTGIETGESVESYTRGVISFFTDDKLSCILRDNCQKSKHLFSIKTMAETFATGIECSLEK
jgi:L-malate glycosyltransferase